MGCSRHGLTYIITSSTSESRPITTVLCVLRRCCGGVWYPGRVWETCREVTSPSCLFNVFKSKSKSPSSINRTPHLNTRLRSNFGTLGLPVKFASNYTDYGSETFQLERLGKLNGSTIDKVWTSKWFLFLSIKFVIVEIFWLHCRNLESSII